MLAFTCPPPLAACRGMFCSAILIYSFSMPIAFVISLLFSFSVSCLISFSISISSSIRFVFVVVFLSLFVFDFFFLRVCPLGLYRFHFRPRVRNRFSDCDSDCGFDLDSDFVFDSFSLKISFWTFLCNLGSAIGFINSRAQGPRTEHAVGGGPCPRCGRGGHVYGQVRVYFAFARQIYKSRGQVPRPLPHRTRGSMRKTAQKNVLGDVCVQF